MEQQAEVSTLLEQGETLLLKEGRDREAAASFARALQVDPNAIAAHLGLAEASLALGDFNVTQAACQHVQQLNPSSAEAFVAGAIQAALVSNYPATVAALDHALTLDPGRPYANALRGFALRRIGQRYEGSLAEARAARALGTRDLDHLFARLPMPAATPAAAPTPTGPEPERPPEPGAAPYSGPRPWDQRSQAERRAVQIRFLTRGVPVATYSLLIVNIAIYLLCAFVAHNLITPINERDALDPSNPLYAYGVSVGAIILQDPLQAYRIVTAMFLHVNIIHIFFNMFSLYSVGAITERIFGTWRFTLIYFATGIIAGIAQAFLTPDIAALGASGAIFGIFGAFGAFILLRRRQLGPVANAMLGQWIFFVILNLAFTFGVPGIGIWDHVGGLVSGFILGAIATLAAGRARRV